MQPRPNAPSLPALSTSGRRIVDPHGDTVALRGVGLGGWMNMENFISGYPSNEATTRAAMRAAMKPGAYEAFFETFLDAFLADDDAAFLAGLGVNSVRLPVNYRHFESDDEPFAHREEGFQRLDAAIETLGRHGIYSVIDLHAVPGSQNHHWHSDNATHLPAFWDHPHFQDRVVALWEAIAQRYCGRGEVAGYNPVNEPADESGERVIAFYDRLIGAIRAEDPDHILFLDGNRYSTDFSGFERLLGDHGNLVFTAHDYALPGIASAAEYPGVTRGEYFDRSAIEESFHRRTEFMQRTDTPIWIGEFGPQYPDPSQNPWRLRLLQDQLDIYAEHGASWALWTYKDVGLQGLVTTDPSGPYMRTIAPTLAAKERLGVDSWGGSDAGIRSILDPIDAVFDAEFPGYEPYPWGRRQHIARLVRHILLAEPLAERHALLFAELDADAAADLANDFLLDRCVVRTPLTETLAAHLTADLGAHVTSHLSNERP